MQTSELVKLARHSGWIVAGNCRRTFPKHHAFRCFHSARAQQHTQDHQTNHLRSFSLNLASSLRYPPVLHRALVSWVGVSKCNSSSCPHLNHTSRARIHALHQQMLSRIFILQAHKAYMAKYSPADHTYIYDPKSRFYAEPPARGIACI
jgi:hypothetical protein